MRTVLEALALCPRLRNFVVSLLARLVANKIWTDDALWRGWILCVRQTQPASLPLLLRLPLSQLSDVFAKAADLQPVLTTFVADVAAKPPAAVSVC
jgi:symplekin